MELRRSSWKSLVQLLHWHTYAGDEKLGNPTRGVWEGRPTHSTYLHDVVGGKKGGELSFQISTIQ